MSGQGSVLTNKYAEGYPGRRYYGGCEAVDIAERLAIERACQFRLRLRNVAAFRRPGRQAVFFALMQPGDSSWASIAAGGHLTHGAPANQSGKWFKVAPYTVRREDQRIDMDEVARIARESKPKVIIAGGSAYARAWDFARFREIADEVGAYFMVDMAHFAGLVAGGAHDSPVPCRATTHHHADKTSCSYAARRHGADECEAIVTGDQLGCRPACVAPVDDTSSLPCKCFVWWRAAAGVPVFMPLSWRMLRRWPRS